MAAQKQTKASAHEAGGIMLGRLLLDSADVVIDEVTEPAAADKRSRFSFWRSPTSHQRKVNLAWESTNGTSIYLGEWHSHPEPDPSPSRQDLKNWRRITQDAKFEQGELLFVIVGTKSICMWQCPTDTLIPFRLAPLSSADL